MPIYLVTPLSCLPVSPMPLAAIELEFLGQSSWWIAAVAVTGLALLVYAFLLRRDARLNAQNAPSKLPLSPSPLVPMSSTAPERLTLLGLPLALLSALVAIAALLLTLPVVLLNPVTGRGPLAMLWTLLVLIVAVYLFYRRVYQYLPPFRMFTLFALRALGLATLTFLLFQPVLGFIKNPDSKPRLAIVIDASGSMSYSDAPNQPNRYRQATIAVQNTLIPRLEKNFDLQIFAYDGKHPAPLHSADDLDQIPPNGDSTDLGAAISIASAAGSQQTILISDGIHNGPVTVESEIANISTPVHTVRVGSSEVEPSSVPDIAVVAVEGPQTATVNNLVTLTASIKSTALSDRTIKVQLYKAGDGIAGTGGGGGTQLDEQRLVLRSGPTPQTVQLKFTPDKVGRTVVRVQVPVDPGERSEANNQQDYPLLVTDPKLAVLYVEGRVRPEVGPLRRLLDQDPNISAISMVQMQAGKFDLKGVKEGDDLKGLPTTLAQWKRFKVIILGDLDASFLSPRQQKDLEQTIREGAGLLMIGGQNSFAPGGWDKSTLATLLPVSLDHVQPPQLNTKFVPQITAAGLVHPIFRNITSYFIAPDGKKPQQQMPDLDGCVALASPKAGAVVLAVHPTERVNNAPATVLAVQQYGQGRTAAFAADTTWHWNLFLRAMEKDSPYNRFWGQMVRYLASQEDLQKKSGPSVAAMLAKERYEAGEPVTLRAAVTDKEGQSTNYASVWADITGPDGKTIHVPLAATAEEGRGGGTGIYEALHHPKMSGPYKVLFAASKDNAPLGKDETSFIVLAAAAEKDVLVAQPKTLQLIAHATNARYVELAAIASLADSLAAALPPASIAAKTRFPLFHTRWFFLLFIASFAAEWLLRRKWQLQ